MKIVINRCYGGFGLSHKAVMRYAELKGFKLYPFVEKRDRDGKLIRGKFESYKGDEAFLIHYSKEPLSNDGEYSEGSYFSDTGIERTDPVLIQVVEELGQKANGRCAELDVIEIPDDVEWEIDEYDGIERVDEKHKSWS